MPGMTADNRLVAIILEVSDLDRSATLYREGFGLDLHASDHESDDRWMGGAHAALSWTDGAYLHFALYQAKGPEITTGTQIGFAVDDLDAAHAAAVAAGAEVVHERREEPWGATARYRDYDGNVIGLTQRG
jgi:predicted enzyme related to lactoylglutathione lyase